MDRDLQAILLNDNPWLLERERLDGWLHRRIPSRYVPRLQGAEERRRWRESDRAHLVVGPRQAGKSTLIWAHLAEHGEPALFVDCEQPLVRAWCRSAPQVLAELERLLPHPLTLFFEEAQHLEEAGLFIKGLVDRKYDAPILVTGSSSFHLGARTRESLAGRATRTRILPFSLDEVAGGTGGEPDLVRRHRRREAFARHVVYGGYPEPWLSNDPSRLLEDLVQAIILRDASDLFRIGRPEAFRRMLQLLAEQSGSLLNYTEWAAILGVSRDTVASYLEILESSHVAAVLTPFAQGKRAELTRTPKAYLTDVGLRNQLLWSFAPLAERADRGALLESWVFSELWKNLPPGVTLHYWRSRSQAEVDFVARRAGEVVGFEVKAAVPRRATLSRSIHSFLGAYRPSRFYIVAPEAEGSTQARDDLEGTEVRWIEPIDVASALADAFAPAER